MPTFLVALAGPIPAPDPIPLPAPVWLFETLLDVTLTLHFAALYLLLGGLLVAVLLDWRGHRARDPGSIAASGAIVDSLPILMTYVINLGVPPLLFSQVLYGRALYTSSVLVAAYWIAVIPILIACYHLLYRMKARVGEGRPCFWQGLGSLACAWVIARIYTANMTLMIDPASWSDAYRADQTGTLFLTGPASWARWVYMVSAGLAAAGVLMAWLALVPSISEPGRRTLRAVAPWPALVGTLVALAAGLAAWWGQPESVRSALSFSNVAWMAAVAAWLAGAAGVLVAGLRLFGAADAPGWKPAAFISLAAFVQALGFVVARGLVRDSALSACGFDVWDRVVVVNWSVLLLFFALFVAGLGVVGWLAWVAASGMRAVAKGGVG